MAEALRVRTRAGLGLEEAVCVYDLAEHLGIEVRFTDIPSMEGMYYLASEPSIILSSLRPPGRRVFTCAHELGHHSNGDGTTIDQLVQEPRRSGFDTKEFAADCFGGRIVDAEDGCTASLQPPGVECSRMYFRSSLHHFQLFWRRIFDIGPPHAEQLAAPA